MDLEELKFANFLKVKNFRKLSARASVGFLKWRAFYYLDKTKPSYSPLVKSKKNSGAPLFHFFFVTESLEQLNSGFVPPLEFRLYGTIVLLSQVFFSLQNFLFELGLGLIGTYEKEFARMRLKLLQSHGATCWTRTRC